jgi:hypothetical protein
MIDPDPLAPGRYYLMSDAGSFYSDNEYLEGFESPEAAVGWARAQTDWPDLLADLADGVAATVVLGREVNKANAAWQEWADAGAAGPYPDVSVRNHAIDLGLVAGA